MCTLTQFFVPTITKEVHAEYLTKLFMENVVLLFSMVVILVVGANSQFNSIFKDIFTALGIIYWPP